MYRRLGSTSNNLRANDAKTSIGPLSAEFGDGSPASDTDDQAQRTQRCSGFQLLADSLHLCFRCFGAVFTVAVIAGAQKAHCVKRSFLDFDPLNFLGASSAVELFLIPRGVSCERSFMRKNMNGCARLINRKLMSLKATGVSWTGTWGSA